MLFKLFSAVVLFVAAVSASAAPFAAFSSFEPGQVPGDFGPGSHALPTTFIPGDGFITFDLTFPYRAEFDYAINLPIPVQGVLARELVVPILVVDNPAVTVTGIDFTLFGPQHSALSGTVFTNTAGGSLGQADLLPGQVVEYRVPLLGVIHDGPGTLRITPSILGNGTVNTLELFHSGDTTTGRIDANVQGVAPTPVTEQIAFRIITDPVPEPASFALLAIASVACLRRRS